MTRVARESSIYLAARLLPAVVSLASIFVLTRFLSGADYGRYALIMSVIGFLNVAFFTWVGQAFYRSFSSFVGSDRARLLTTTLGCFVGSLLLATLVGLTIGIAAGVSPWSVLLLGSLLLLGALASLDLISLYANARGSPGVYAGLQMGRVGATLLAGGGAAYLTGSVEVVIAAVAVSWSVLALSAGMIRWIQASSRRRFDRSVARELFRYGAPLTLAIALMQAVSTLDRAMLMVLKGEQAVGEYAAAFDLVQFSVGAIGSAVSLVFFPRLFAAFAHQPRTAMEPMLRDYASIQFAILIPAAAGLALVGPLLVTILVGPDLRNGSSAVIPWIAVAMFFGVAKAFYADLSFQLVRWTTGNLIIAAVTLATTAGLNLILIPANGAEGAAQASLGGFLMATAASFVLGNAKAIRMPIPWFDLLKIVVSAGIMAVLVNMVEVAEPLWALLLKVTLGASAYVLAMLILDAGELRRHMAGWLKSRSIASLGK